MILKVYLFELHFFLFVLLLTNDSFIVVSFNPGLNREMLEVIAKGGVPVGKNNKLA